MEGFKVHQHSGHSLHPIQHAVREYATAAAMVDAYSHGYTYIVSVFGSDRDRRIVAFLNRDVPEARQITLAITGTTVVGSDVTRRRRPHVSAWPLVEVPPETGIAVLLVDIYHAVHIGAEKDAPLTPESLRTLHEQVAENYGSEPAIYAVLHRMQAAVGTIEGEGAWIRGADGLVSFKPDDRAAPYPRHSPCDWWFNQAAMRGYGWATLLDVSDSSIQLFCAAPLEEEARERVQPRVAATVVDLPNLASSYVRSVVECIRAYVPASITAGLLSYMPKRKVVIDQRITARVADWLHNRQINAYTMRQLSGMIRDLLVKETWFQRTRDLFPEELQALVDDNVLYALLRNIETRAGDALALETVYGEEFSSHNKRLQNLGSAPQGPTASWTPILALVAAAAAWYWFKPRSHQPLAAGWSPTGLIQRAQALAGRVTAAAKDALGRLVTHDSVAKPTSPLEPIPFRVLRVAVSKWLDPLHTDATTRQQVAGMSTFMIARLVDVFWSVPILEELIRPFMERVLGVHGAILWNVLMDTAADYCHANGPWANNSTAPFATFVTYTAVRIALHSVFALVRRRSALASIALHMAWNRTAVKWQLALDPSKTPYFPPDQLTHRNWGPSTYQPLDKEIKIEVPPVLSNMNLLDADSWKALLARNDAAYARQTLDAWRPVRGSPSWPLISAKPQALPGARGPP